MAAPMSVGCFRCGPVIWPFRSHWRMLTTSVCMFKKLSMEAAIHRKSQKYLNRKLNETVAAKRNRPWYDSPQPQMFGEGMGRSGKPSVGRQRRAKQLSVVLYEYISSMINSGEIGTQLPDLGIDIVRVKMAPDMSNITVYWAATGSEKDDMIEKILPQVGYKLRTLLVSLHIMGNLPPIQFSKDTTASRLQEVERLLAVADYGPDYEPNPLDHHLLKQPLSLQYDEQTLQDKIAHLAHVFEDKNLNKQIHSRFSQEGTSHHESSSADRTSSEGICDVDVSTKSAGDSSRNEPELMSSELSDSERQGDSVRKDKDDADVMDLSVPLRSDLYNVNHHDLLKKLENIKRRHGRAVPGPVVEVSSDEKAPGLQRLDIKKRVSKRTMLRRAQNEVVPGSAYSHVEQSVDDNYDDNDYDEEIDFLDERDRDAKY